MAQRTASEPVDALVLRARIHTLRIGAWPSIFGCVALALYLLATPQGAHRTALWGLDALSLLASLALVRVPIEPLVRGPWREGFFVAWSASLIVLVSVMSGLDGGVHSPLASAYFGPLVYAALSYPLRSLLLVAAADIVAFLTVGATVGGADVPFVLLTAATLFTAAWICAWQAHNLDGQRRALAVVSRTDPLTGALNRRGFDERLGEHLAAARDTGRSVSLVLLDLDDFKQVNDTHGHAAGDALLCWVVETLRAQLGPGDDLGRLGGDEFALVLDQDTSLARGTVDHLLRVLAARAEVSAGVAGAPLDGLDAEALHQIADAELYERKRGGRRARPAARELSWATALAGCVDDRIAVEQSPRAPWRTTPR